MLRRYIILCASVIIVCGILFFYLMFNVITQRCYSPEPADYIVILGHSLDDGETPSDWLVARMQEGLRLYELGYAPFIIVTGGKPDTYEISVAESMSDWLIEHGVPQENIIEETDASNTFENFKLSREFTGDASIIVVTNDFHMYRSVMIAGDHFDDVSGSSASTAINFQKVMAYCKEPLSIIKYIALHRR